MKSIAESIETLERLGFELFGVVPGAVVRDDGGAVMIRTGVKVALCNGVFRVRWTRKTWSGRSTAIWPSFRRAALPS